MLTVTSHTRTCTAGPCMGSQGVSREMKRSPSTKPFLVPPVSRIMLLLGLEHPHVLPPVVGLDSVHVVNHLSLLQLATQLLRNITMHGHSRVSKPLVALPVLAQLRQEPGQSPISTFSLVYQR